MAVDTESPPSAVGTDSPKAPQRRRSIPARIWRNYGVRRTINAIGVVFVVANVTFFLARAMPGDPVEVMAGRLSQGGMTWEQAYAIAQSSLAYDSGAPIWQQWWEYMSGLAMGDMGTSVLYPGDAVFDVIMRYLPWTLFSVGIGVSVAILLGLTLGMVMAYRRNTSVDHVLSVAASIFGAIPNYLIAMALVIGGSTYLGLFSFLEVRGTVSPGVEPGFTPEFLGDILFHAILPILTYVLSVVGSWMLVMKASTTEVLSDDYVMVARARGLRDRDISVSYVGRNAVLPLVSQIAIALGTLVGGAIFVEQVLAYKGVGGLLLESVNNRDYPVLQGLLLILTACVVAANLVSDLIYGLLDPRIRNNDVEAA